MLSTPIASKRTTPHALVAYRRSKRRPISASAAAALASIAIDGVNMVRAVFTAMSAVCGAASSSYRASPGCMLQGKATGRFISACPGSAVLIAAWSLPLRTAG